MTSRTSLPSLKVCSTMARSDVISCSLMAKSTSSIISGKSMSLTTMTLNYFFFVAKGAFTLANFARDFALSLHILLNKNYLFSLLNVQASAKSRAKSRQCKRTLMDHLHWQTLGDNAGDSDIITCLGHLGWHDTVRIVSIYVATPKVAKASK